MYSNLPGEFLGTFMLVILGCGVVVNVCLKKTNLSYAWVPVLGLFVGGLISFELARIFGFV
jgi:glycerol uptake facilitator-like aquaporin